MRRPQARGINPLQRSPSKSQAFSARGRRDLTLRNLSTIPNESVPTIQTLLERDLKAHGISLAGEEGANAIRVTLSENTRERLWIAEVAEGATTQVAIVEAGPIAEQHAVSTTGLTLRAQTILTSRRASAGGA